MHDVGTHRYSAATHYIMKKKCFDFYCNYFDSVNIMIIIVRALFFLIS